MKANSKMELALSYLQNNKEATVYRVAKLFGVPISSLYQKKRKVFDEGKTDVCREIRYCSVCGRALVGRSVQKQSKTSRAVELVRQRSITPYAAAKAVGLKTPASIYARLASDGKKIGAVCFFCRNACKTSANRL